MARAGFNRLLGPPVRRPVARKIRGKDSEQVKTFINLIDGELEQFVKVIEGSKNHGKAKRFN
jgi:cell division septum initiation protein DivIVA